MGQPAEKNKWNTTLKWFIILFYLKSIIFIFLEHKTNIVDEKVFFLDILNKYFFKYLKKIFNVSKDFEILLVLLIVFISFCFALKKTLFVLPSFVHWFAACKSWSPVFGEISHSNIYSAQTTDKQASGICPSESRVSKRMNNSVALMKAAGYF